MKRDFWIMESGNGRVAANKAAERGNIRKSSACHFTRSQYFVDPCALVGLLQVRRLLTSQGPSLRRLSERAMMQQLDHRDLQRIIAAGAANFCDIVNQAGKIKVCQFTSVGYAGCIG